MKNTLKNSNSVTTTDYAVDTYAVFGNPIAHSKSPFIHRAFARQTGQNLDYYAEWVPLEGFAKAVRDFYARGGKGLNVTVPFKQEAWAICAQRSARAAQAGAVNTLYFGARGEIIGDNTDGIGMMRDIVNNHDYSLAERSVLILGAGGAVRGILPVLLEQAPARIVIANRTPAKAEELAHALRVPTLSACAYADLDGQEFDVIINGTSAGLHGDLPPLPETILRPGGLTYDIVYANEATAFVRWGRAHGAALALDGLGMLVEQAAEAFYLWRGVRPITATVMQELRAMTN
jgi:shikimate dehydrogenase